MVLRGAEKILKKYWPAIAIALIIVLAIYVRVLDYDRPYLRNIDSYAFTRQMNDIVENGGTMPVHDDLSLAPDGVDRGVGRDLYVHLGAWLFMLLRNFGVGFLPFLVWFPAVVASLMAIPMYFIGKLLYDRKAGVLAAFFIVFDIAVMSRTLGADPDNDGSVLLFPLISMALFLMAYMYVNREKRFDRRALIYAIIAGIGLGAWGYIWSGFWFIVWLITGFLTIRVVIELITSRVKGSAALGQVKKFGLLFIVMMIVFFLITIPGIGTNVVGETVQGPFQFGDIKSEANREFPNVYVSVAELQPGGEVRSVIQRTSPINFDQNPLAFLISPFMLMIYSLIYLLFSAFKRRMEHLDTLILLFIWFVGPFIATVIAVRFSILFAAPMAIGSAIILSKLFRMARGEKFSE